MMSLFGLRGMMPFYLYILATFVVSKFLMPDYEALHTKEQELESDYRFCQTRLRNHAESVAFFGGDNMEHGIASKYFTTLVDHMYVVRRKTAEFKFMCESLNPSTALLLLVCLAHSDNLNHRCRCGAVHCLNKDFKQYSNNMSTPELVTIFMQMIYARTHPVAAAGEGGKPHQHRSSIGSRVCRSSRHVICG